MKKIILGIIGFIFVCMFIGVSIHYGRKYLSFDDSTPKIIKSQQKIKTINGIMEITLNGKVDSETFKGKWIAVDPDVVLVLEIRGMVAAKNNLVSDDELIDSREVIAFTMPGEYGLYCLSKNQFQVHIVPQEAGKIQFKKLPSITIAFSELYSFQNIGGYVQAPLEIAYWYIDKSDFSWEPILPKRVQTLKPIGNIPNLDEKIIEETKESVAKIKDKLSEFKEVLIGDTLETKSKPKQ